MRATHVIDLLAMAFTAVILILPNPSVAVQPAMSQHPATAIDVDEVGSLEDSLRQKPEDVERAIALADGYLRVEHPDWALATLARFTTEPQPHRVHFVRAIAHAERLLPEPAVKEMDLADKACAAEGEAKCSATERVHMDVIGNSMRALANEHIDPHADPARARAAVGRVLRGASADLPLPKK